MRRIAIISVILVALIAAGAWSFLATSDDDADELSFTFDDYVQTSELRAEPVTASGSLTLTSIAGISYIRAIDTGEGKITYADETSETFTVGKAKLDVYMIAGQSNAEYRGNSATPSMIEGLVPGTAYYYGTETRPPLISIDETSTYGIHSMVNVETGAAVIGGLDAPLAADLVASIGNKVLIINTAVGGTSIGTWMPAATNYLRAQTLFADALSQIDLDHYDVTVRDYLWCQGEANSSTPVSSYKTSFLLMHASMITADEFSELPFQNAMIVKIQAAKGVNSSQAQIELPAIDSTIILATTISDTFTVANGLLVSDNLHYSQAGHILIAEDVAEKIKETRK